MCHIVMVACGCFFQCSSFRLVFVISFFLISNMSRRQHSSTVSATADIAFANPDPACRDGVFLAWCRHASLQRLVNPIMMKVYRQHPDPACRDGGLLAWWPACLVQACQTSEAPEPNHDEGVSGSTQIQHAEMVSFLPGADCRCIRQHPDPHANQNASVIEGVTSITMTTTIKVKSGVIDPANKILRKV